MIRLELRRAKRERGWASAMVVVILLVCASTAAAAVFQNIGARREAEAVLARERAFQAAEAGCDWGLVGLRKTRGEIPDPSTETVALDGSAQFTVRYGTGETNGTDDDGDGTVDESDEGDFVVVNSTGQSGGVRRTLQLLLQRVVSNPSFPAATHIDDPTPVVDVNGNSFRVEGEDHRLDGTIDPLLPTKYGITSPATAATLAAQIPATRADQITGTGGEPSVGQSSSISLDELIQQAVYSATLFVPSGTIDVAAWGTPTPDGVEVVVCQGDLHVTGSLTGAGVLVIEGDLSITGRMSWIGIILVRGGVRFAGGGNTKRMIGAMACSDELQNQSVTLSGTVDLLYSSAGVELATQAMSMPIPRAWREVGSP